MPIMPRYQVQKRLPPADIAADKTLRQFICLEVQRVLGNVLNRELNLSVFFDGGFCLLLLFSLKRPFGSFLLDNFDIKVVQTWTGCVIAASVIAFPLMYRNARAAFEQVDVNLIYAGRTLGMSESRIFWKVIIPAAGPGIASGTVLAFARAIGEYGATSMLAGNILGKTRTVSVAIASETAAGNYDMAGFWVVVIILISFLVVAAINIASGRGMQTRRWI